MNGSARIGLIGCGNIALTYLNNFKEYFKQFEVVACADIIEENARRIAEEFNIKKCCTPEDLLNDDAVDIVLNLTIPAAHSEINIKALQSGKHVYCEKPLAMTLEDAQEQIILSRRTGLRIGCAPDTFLGTGIQTCKRIIDNDFIGTPVAATANMVNGYGHELWHPNPEFLYKPGAGPMLDMGVYYVTALVSLLGSVKRISCFAKRTHEKRTIMSMPFRGKVIDVEVNTHYTGILEFHNGVFSNLTVSNDVWQSHLPKLEIYGTDGSLVVPDPNMFGGEVLLLRGNEMLDSINGLSTGEAVDKIHSDEMFGFFERFPLLYKNVTQNYRGLGLSDMYESIKTGKKHKASVEQAYHVLEVLLGFDKAAESRSSYLVQSTLDDPFAAASV